MFVPTHFTSDSTGKLVVSYERNWRDFPLLPLACPTPLAPLTVKDIIKSVLVGRRAPEAVFEYFPDANK